MKPVLKYRNVYGEIQNNKFEGIKFDQSVTESCAIKGNKKFTAFPWQSTGGGIVCVLENEKI